MNQKVQVYVGKLSQLLYSHGYNSDHAKQIVWWVIEAVTKITPLMFVTSDKEISSEDAVIITGYIQRYIQEAYPLQYLLKNISFAGVQLSVEPPVLIPRPETEEWVVNIISQLAPLKMMELEILDMCTGSGCIGLALANALPNAKITLVDTAPHALALATKNMITNKFSNVFIITSDLYTNLVTDQKFDLIVSNPPYITSDEWEKLEPMVQRWEDKQALEAGHDGLSIIKPLIQQASPYLKSKSVLDEYRLPRLIIEIGYMQGTVVKELCIQAGFTTTQIVKDFAGCDRVVACLK